MPAPAQAGTLKATFTSFSPRVTLDYNFQQGGTIYALWSRGYRPGGFNNSLVGQPAAVLAGLGNLNVGLAFKQEKLDNYEAGIKGTWLDNRLQVALGGYFDQWRNGQVSNSIAVQTPTNIQMVTATQNVGSVDMYGIEFTGAFAATEHLTITGNANYVHSKILSFVFAPNGPRINGTTNVNGHSFSNVPVGWTFTVSPQYTAHLAGDWDWYARLDWKHRGRYYPDATNLNWIGARDIIDVHLGVKNETFSIEAFALNLNKDYTFQSGEAGADALCCSTTAPNINEVRLLLPAKRQFGIRGTYSF